MPALETDSLSEPKALKTEPTHTVEDAIREATNDRVRFVLLNMVKENPVARELASKALLVQRQESSPTGNNKKRKRFEICSQCSKEYAVEENHGKICVHHPGAKRVDFDSGSWKSIKNDEDIKDGEESQEGYEWTCCHGRGDAQGCRVSEHSPQEIKQTKLKHLED